VPAEAPHVLDEQAGRGDAAAERARLEKLFLALA
jgi:hypothetical protein